MKKILIETSVKYPKTIVTISLLLFLIALLQFPKAIIDTNPEHMLSQDEQAILDHHKLKETFKLDDFLVIGIHKETGVFNPKTLQAVYEITKEALELEGVISEDLISLTEVDDIISDGGSIKVQNLMEEVPETNEDAQKILERIKINPLFKGKLASDDGTLVSIFVPLKSKEISSKIAEILREASKKHLINGEDFLLAGLPIAENTFGDEMFKQMGIYAPLAGLVIFLLLWFFFGNVKIISIPMLLAIMTVVYTMGSLIGLGFTVHIMSSMIPIFLMPMSVLDSVHIVSEFYDTYQKTKDKSKTIKHVMNSLFMPMFYTSLTTIAGFISLTFVNIPPVQVFGLFVAFGVAIAWILTIFLLPSLIMLLPEKIFANFGEKLQEKHQLSVLDKFLNFQFKLAEKHGKKILLATILLSLVSFYGIKKIIVNDNPVNWFKPTHELRKADALMNSKIGGTYMSHLVFSGKPEEIKSPEVIDYIAKVQDKINSTKEVGGSTSVVDILKKINVELLGNPDYPKTQEGIAQYLFLFEISGGAKEDLFKFITSDYSQAQIWIQMPKGDNKLMHSFVNEIQNFMKNNPPPENIKTYWGGLNYVNVVWQDKMVGGMINSLLGSFAMVFLMMILLFRSFKWGIISMLPLSFTIIVIYGLIGFTGKFYDMPIAILSSLTLGLSIDFAIHFIERATHIHKITNNFEKTFELLFDSTARAIFRNIAVISVGFMPLFFATLVPYQTVGTFFFAIMIVSGFTTLLVLPAISFVFNKYLFSVKQ